MIGDRRPGGGPARGRPTRDSAATLGQELTIVHDQLRTELARLREDPAAGPGLTFPEHCLAFCAMLTDHHRGEDSTVFPAVSAEHPELREVLAELTRDHHVIQDILAQVDRLARSRRPATAIRAELDGLAAICESHFAWEERRLMEALDAIPG